MSRIVTENLDNPLAGDYFLREQPDEEDVNQEDSGKKRTKTTKKTIMATR